MAKREHLVWVRVLAYSAVATMLWLKYRAPRGTQDKALLLLFVAGLAVFSYYTARFLRESIASGKAIKERTFVARACNVGFYWFGVVSTLACIGSTAVILLGIRRGVAPGQNLQALALMSAFFGTLFTWAGAYQVAISDDAIEYWSLFAGYRWLRRDEIDRGRIWIGWRSYRDRYWPTFRLEIEPIKGTPPKRPIIVALKVFSKRDVDRVFDWLGPKLCDEHDLTAGSHGQGFF